MTSLVWMRRDLRLHDHAPLATALMENKPIQPVFLLDSDILARFPNPADRRLSFIAATLVQLDATLRAQGGSLMVLHGKPHEVMPKLAAAIAASAIYSAEDFEPATRARDAAVKAALPPATRFVQLVDHLMLTPQQLLKKDGTPYKVFTPYYKVWRSEMTPQALAAYEVNAHGRYADAARMRDAAQRAGLHPLPVEEGAEALLKRIGYHYQPDPLWPVNTPQQRLHQFIAARLGAYPSARDTLSIQGTSQLSPYLRHGLISIREAMRAALEAGGPSAEKWISELAWREFYAAILYHFPEVVEHEFAPQYRHGAIPWSHDARLIHAFESGQTGYPVVDAAVRELLSTGYMHNRARMIVASFVTKDLLLDWRLGEAFFAQHLMDYELASNNGGWQWAASTGTDAAPYFRIFNPVLQSRKFDPAGEYIRRHVPELRSLSDRDIHAPWESPLTRPRSYPLPVVDHAEAKARVIGLFKNAGQALMP